MSKTLSQLRELVKQKADIEGGSTRVSTEELDGYINGGFGELHGILSRRFEDRFTTVSAEIVVTGANNTIQLPSDYHQTRLLEIKGGDGKYWPVDRTTLREKHKWDVSAIWSGGTGVRAYMVVQNAIVLFPEADASGTYRHWYSYRYDPLVDEADEVDDEEEWFWYGVICAAIECVRKDEGDLADLMMAKAELLARIVEESTPRDASGPRRVVDVRGFDDEFWNSRRRVVG